MSNIELFHRYLTQTLVSTADPFIETFCDVRNSSVENSSILNRELKSPYGDKTQKLIESTGSVQNSLNQIHFAHTKINMAIENVEKLLSASAAVEDHHAAIFMESDSSSNSEMKDDSWEDV